LCKAVVEDRWDVVVGGFSQRFTRFAKALLRAVPVIDLVLEIDTLQALTNA
jgi:hypothetical protein